MIRADKLSKHYGSVVAVDGVSFSVEAGDIVGLLGPNGSGKTTIMRMLTGFFAPTSGSCCIAGIDVRTDSRAARRHIGYLPENIALYPDMSVRAYLGFAARTRGFGQNLRRRVDEVMEECGLADMSRRTIGKLSRGYRQRVGIAQAIVHRPDVLIMDEPTVGLDPRQIVEIRALIRKLAATSTVLLSTHILPEVSVTCRRVLILDKGRLVAQDSAEGLSRRTAGRGETYIKLRAPAAEAVTALSALDGVRGVDTVDSTPDGIVAVVVATDGGQDLAPQMASCVLERGWPLYEMSPKLMSLEELFVQILEESEVAVP
ncbi:MAG: ABC transporter ATP-binding protein [Candidatus Binatia bacterium]